MVSIGPSLGGEALERVLELLGPLASVDGALAKLGEERRRRLSVFGQEPIRPFPRPLPEVPPRLEPRGIPDTDLESLLRPGGRLAAAVEQAVGVRWRDRPGQRRMLRAVQRAIEERGVLLVEAGTGVGKSAAYLIPALAAAATQGLRTVVSTATIALQDQLAQKDLPLFVRHLGWPFRFEVLKGRANYLCRQRWEDEWRRVAGGGADAERIFYAQVAAWLATTLTGDERDLGMSGIPTAEGETDPTGRDRAYWRELTVGVDACLKKDCPHYQSCYFYHARRRAEAADLVVVNHALLVQHLLTEGRILPDFDILVVDEAHRLAEVATQAVAATYATREADRLMIQLAHRLGIGRSEPAGHLEAKRLASAVASVRRNVEALNRAIGAAGARLGSGAFLVLAAPDEGGGQLAIEPTGRGGPDAADDAIGSLRAAGRDAHAAMGDLAQLIEASLEPLESDSDTANVRLAGDTPARAALSELRSLMSALDQTLLAVPAGFVSWLEAEAGWEHATPPQRSSAALQLVAQPLEVASFLGPTMFPEGRTAILTSATLTGDPEDGLDGFAYPLNQLGLTERADVTHLRVLSPFDLASQMRLLCVTGAAFSGRQSERQANEAGMWEALGQVLEITAGRTLVLFSNRGEMVRAARLLAPRLAQRGTRLLAQHLDGSPYQLINELKADARVVLFGLRGLAEGVDVPGDRLSCVVYVRLPYPNLYDPLGLARRRRIEAAGGDAFRQLALPSAVIQFRQGVGRLIRSEDDRGVIVILDSRLGGHGGRAFLGALSPRPEIVLAPLPALLEELAQTWASLFGASTPEGN